MTGYVLAAEPRQSIDVMNRVVVQVWWPGRGPTLERRSFEGGKWQQNWRAANMSGLHQSIYHIRSRLHN